MSPPELLEAEKHSTSSVGNQEVPWFPGIQEMLPDCLLKLTVHMSIEACLCSAMCGCVNSSKEKCLRAKSPALQSSSWIEGRLLALQPTWCGPCTLLLCVNKSCLQYSLLDSQRAGYCICYYMLMSSETKRCIHSRVVINHPTLWAGVAAEPSTTFSRLTDTAHVLVKGRTYCRHHSAICCFHSPLAYILLIWSTLRTKVWLCALPVVGVYCWMDEWMNAILKIAFQISSFWWLLQMELVQTFCGTS